MAAMRWRASLRPCGTWRSGRACRPPQCRTFSAIASPSTRSSPNGCDRAAAELDYRIDRAASLLRSGKTQVICALVPSLENPFFTSLIAAVERGLRADGYDVIIASGNDEADERARMAALLSWRPAGVVVVPSTDRFVSRGSAWRTCMSPTSPSTA